MYLFNIIKTKEQIQHKHEVMYGFTVYIKLSVVSVSEGQVCYNTANMSDPVTNEVYRDMKHTKMYWQSAVIFPIIRRIRIAITNMFTLQ